MQPLHQMQKLEVAGFQRLRVVSDLACALANYVSHCPVDRHYHHSLKQIPSSGYMREV